MDFGSLLYKAQRNEQSSKQNNGWYKTTFAPPKKEQREKKLSVNIQKFLARKEEEERQKKLDAERKKQDLLTLRNKDKKSFKRVQSMLKSTKSANKSVLEDAVDNVNTALTIDGPLQPDEDDYGYVSKDATELYNKLINKYSSMPSESLFSKTPVKSSTDILSTKDRVKAALQREEDEKLLPRKRKRKSKSTGNGEDDGTGNNEKTESDEEAAPDSKSSESTSKPKFKIPKKNAQLPPPMDFQTLLKVAQQKQFEPVVIEKKVEEPERPMTGKEKQEMLREKERKLRREGRLSEASKLPLKKNPSIRPESREKNTPASTKLSTDQDRGKIVNSAPKKIGKDEVPHKKSSVTGAAVANVEKKAQSSAPTHEMKSAKSSLNGEASRSGTKINSSKKAVTFKDEPKVLDKRRIIEEMKRKQLLREAIERKRSAVNEESRMSSDQYGKEKLKGANTMAVKKPLKSAEESSKIRPAGPTKSAVPARSTVQSGGRQFPPPDVARRRPLPPPAFRRKMIVSDDEYDSEMDDFIDDTDDTNDYSSQIAEIFKYDKSKYARRDFDDDSDECMESNFSELQKEEYISTKYGIMEDLADIRREKLEKMRKKKRAMSYR